MMEEIKQSCEHSLKLTEVAMQIEELCGLTTKTLQDGCDLTPTVALAYQKAELATLHTIVSMLFALLNRKNGE
jgi:hypothetical protein